MAKKEIDNEKKKSNFFKELKSELKKVTWPTFKKLVNNTSAVITIVVLLAVIVFAIDVCFENLNSFGVGKLKSIVSTDSEEIVESGEIIDGSTQNVELVTEGEEENTETEEAIDENVVSNEETENNSGVEVTQ